MRVSDIFDILFFILRQLDSLGSASFTPALFLYVPLAAGDSRTLPPPWVAGTMDIVDYSYSLLFLLLLFITLAFGGRS